MSKFRKGRLTGAFTRAVNSLPAQDAMMQYTVNGTGAALASVAKSAVQGAQARRAAKKPAKPESP